MKIHLLTELDAILDTRLGTVDLLDTDAATRLFQNPDYYQRKLDRFEPLCGINEDLYQGAWEARSVDTLKHSMNTPAIELVHRGLVRLERQAIEDPTISEVSLDVNMYPYRLSAAEAHAFSLAIAQCAGVKSGIRLINEPWEALTVERCRAYAGMVLYNHRQWFQHHWQELVNRGMPQVTMVVPKLYPEREFDKNELAIEGLGEVDPWVHSTLPMIEYVALEFADVRNYCIVHPHTPA